ncbi:FAD-binding oxidoreductase [Pelagibaculum spongiae]|uniref:FAD-binding oxidoreductase n=1 Tax=Pelagibaculum spongiae TaxID=2080658 RepID=A0A2V1GTV4_9GAMM|nr:FAD-binding oxidoreductase [Pelagibaculum spongiae]PVZ65608.1 FAD-binding oxidoreductase [Pelagibaculum spongiae]
MRRWNGWGDDANNFPLNKHARKFLESRVGKAKALPDADFKSALKKVPESRIDNPHPLLSTDAEDRLRHARGQSLEDWLAMREGELGPFPDAVCWPETSEDVKQLLAWAGEQNIKVIPYGGGTSVAGHIIATSSDKRPIVTIDMGRMRQLEDLDTASQIATFGAGVAGPDLEAQLKARGYTLGHYPQSWELSTLGGWIATRSSGQQSYRYGRIEQMFAGGEMETPIGTLEIPEIPANSAGQDMRELVLGSEGRLGIITKAKVRVTPKAEHESFHGVFFPNWQQGHDCLQAIGQEKIPVSMLRLSNPEETSSHMVLAGHPYLLGGLKRYLKLRGCHEGQMCVAMIGATGSKSFAKTALKQAIKQCKRFGGIYIGAPLGKKWEHSRFRSPYVRHTMWDAGFAVDTFETCVKWSNVSKTMQTMEQAVKDAAQEMGVKVQVFTHLSHVYAQGSSIYTTYIFNVAKDYPETLQRWKNFKKASSEAIVACGGTISHQHGVGVDHASYLPAEKGELGMKVMRNNIQLMDPGGIMNPGKLVADIETEVDSLAVQSLDKKKQQQIKQTA